MEMDWSEYLRMKTRSYAEVILRFFPTAILIDAILTGVVGLICFILGLRTVETYGIALIWTGVILMFLAAFIGAGGFSEVTDPKTRARRLDEGWEVLTGLWNGGPFSYKGDEYTVKEVTFHPTPVQSPRIPIWVGGWWPNKPPLRRAARWDGVCPSKWGGTITPDEWRELLAYVRNYRASNTPFAAVRSGASPGHDLRKAAAMVEPYAQAGVTWWLETVDPGRFGWSWEVPWAPEATRLMRERILQGPPRIS